MAEAAEQADGNESDDGASSVASSCGFETAYLPSDHDDDDDDDEHPDEYFPLRMPLPLHPLQKSNHPHQTFPDHCEFRQVLIPILYYYSCASFGLVSSLDCYYK